MAALALPQVRDQPSLTEVLNRIDLSGDDPFFQMMAEWQDDVEQSAGFRHAALSTQNRQDRDLAQYRLFVLRGLHRREPNEVPDDEVERLLWPADHEVLARQLQVAVRCILELSRPRSRHDSHVTYATLTKTRDSMLWWVYRKYSERKVSPVSPIVPCCWKLM